MDDYEIFSRLLDELKAGRRCVLVTIIEQKGTMPRGVGSKMLVTADGGLYGSIGGGTDEFELYNFIKDNFHSLKPFTKRIEHLGEKDCGGYIVVYVEPILPRDHLYIIGAGHCGRALARLARRVGFRVTLVDNREQALRDSQGLADEYLLSSDYDDLDELIKGDGVYIVIMTSGHVWDEKVLDKCLALNNWRYIGLMGSRKKVSDVMKGLKKRGWSDEVLSKVSAPIGLEIGSRTPEEIAVSVTAELIKVRNLGSL